MTPRLQHVLRLRRQVFHMPVSKTPFLGRDNNDVDSVIILAPPGPGLRALLTDYPLKTTPP
jgi:hypothetical protein